MTPEEVRVENLRRLRLRAANDRVSSALFGPMFHALTGSLRVAIRQKEDPEPLEEQ